MSDVEQYGTYGHPAPKAATLPRVDRKAYELLMHRLITLSERFGESSGNKAERIGKVRDKAICDLDALLAPVLTEQTE